MANDGSRRAAIYLTLAAALNTASALIALALFGPWWDHFRQESAVLVEIFRSVGQFLRFLLW
jgi:hypothetical protein